MLDILPKRKVAKPAKAHAAKPEPEPVKAPHVKPAAETAVTITPPNFQMAKVRLIGTAPFVCNKMSSPNRLKMMEAQIAGSRSKKGQKREPKNFDAVFRGSLHLSDAGWYGFASSGLRNAMIDSCRLTGFKMTIAKLSCFVEADGFDADDGQPLTRFTVGEPVRRDLPVKLASGATDIIARGFFFPWEAEPVLRWDGDQFSASDLINLLARAGGQVGIGAGRPGSRNSAGMGWGTFKVES